MFNLHIKLDTLPKALNKKLRSNWRANHRENQSWDLLIELALHDTYGLLGKRPKSPLEKATIRIVRHSHRMLDFDGLVGSMKPVVDALVSAKILRDDSWGVTGRWDVDQKFRPKSAGPLLEIFVVERMSEK